MVGIETIAARRRPGFLQEPDTRAFIQRTGADDEAVALLRLIKWGGSQWAKLFRSLAGATGLLRISKDFPELGGRCQTQGSRGSQLSKNKKRIGFPSLGRGSAS